MKLYNKAVVIFIYVSVKLNSLFFRFYFKNPAGPNSDDALKEINPVICYATVT